MNISWVFQRKWQFLSLGNNEQTWTFSFLGKTQIQVPPHFVINLYSFSLTMMMTSCISKPTSIIINTRKQDQGKIWYTNLAYYIATYLHISVKSTKIDRIKHKHNEKLKVIRKEKKNRSVPSYSNIYRYVFYAYNLLLKYFKISQKKANWGIHTSTKK